MTHIERCYGAKLMERVSDGVLVVELLGQLLQSQRRPAKGQSDVISRVYQDMIRPIG